MALSRRIQRLRKRKFFFSIKGWDFGYAGRCLWCFEPIMLVKKPTRGLGWRRVPIEIKNGWDGSGWYKRGVHKFHGWSCPEVRRRVQNPDEEEDV